MRKRLTIAIVGLVVGALVLAGAGALLVSHVAARDTALTELRQQAGVVARTAPTINRPGVLLVLARSLRSEDARFIVIGSKGQPETALPPGISASALEAQALLAGQTVSGSVGSLAFVAAPVTLSPRLAGFVPAGQLVVVLTRRVSGLASSWAYLLLVGGCTLVVAAAVASWLSERLARRVLAVSDATIRMAGGELSVRVPASQKDVQELRTLAESVNRMASSLEGSRERERQLLLSVAHDLRTPLTSIRGFAEAIEEGVAETPAEAARVIGKEAIRLERLVGDLLDLAKLDAQRLSLVIEDVDAAEIASSVVSGLSEEARRRAVTLVAEGAGRDAGQVLARADGDRLAQIVANLVDNALAFARTCVRVTVTTGRPGAVVLTVEDDGPGIPPTELSRVFDRFYTGNGPGSGARRGSGLGLSIVAELTSAMGGSVRAESPAVDARGTRMVVELPSSQR